MKRQLLAFATIFICIIDVMAQSKIDVAKQMQLSALQCKWMLNEFDDTSVFPQSALPDESYVRCKASGGVLSCLRLSMVSLWTYKDPVF